MIKPGSTIGIIGGGQLGRMIALAAARMGYKANIYTDKKNSPASYVANKTFVAPYTNKKNLEKFAKSVDVVTFEFENIPHESVKELEKSVPVHPGWNALYISQNRLREKDFLNDIGLPTAPYAKVTSAKTLQSAYKKIGPKCILKTTEFGYDGKGQHIIDKNSDLTKLWKEAKIKEAILEGFVNYTKEISVIVARSKNGDSIPYTPVENIHVNGILDTTKAPSDIDEDLTEEAWEIAHKIADKLKLIGLVAVEMFVTKEGSLLINEIAPRPHNSGHWTMDACVTDQFEQLIRAVCDLPLGSTFEHSRAIMKNLVGEEVEKWSEYILDPDTKIHLYDKNETREGRKMGHVTHLLYEEDIIIDT